MAECAVLIRGAESPRSLYAQLLGLGNPSSIIANTQLRAPGGVLGSGQKKYPDSVIQIPRSWKNGKGKPRSPDRNKATMGRTGYRQISYNRTRQIAPCDVITATGVKFFGGGRLLPTNSPRFSGLENNANDIDSRVLGRNNGLGAGEMVASLAKRREIVAFLAEMACRARTPQPGPPVADRPPSEPAIF